MFGPHKAKDNQTNMVLLFHLQAEDKISPPAFGSFSKNCLARGSSIV